MSKLFKYVFLMALMFGGWALAAASLHVVRAPGTSFWGYVPVNVELVPKHKLTFHETWVDLTKWNGADLVSHPAVVARLEQTDNAHLMNDAKARGTGDPTAVGVPAPAETKAPETKVIEKSTDAAQQPAAEARQKSIFDFSR